jgi:hypothetical protein
VPMMLRAVERLLERGKPSRKPVASHRPVMASRVGASAL